MSTNANTLYVSIDASGVQAGASVTINLINQMMNATDSFNSSVQNAGNSMTNMGNKTAQSASKMSRFIQGLSDDFGKMGSMIALIQPVQMFKSFAKEIADVNQTYTGFVATMAAATNDVYSAGKAYEYVKDVANMYGTNLEQLLENYAKLKGATNTILDTKQIDALFESITAVASVMHLPVQTVNRMFQAITQVASKGQLMMEELKLQLGEHLPGALAIAAASMGMTVKELVAAMKKGEVSAEHFLSAFPAELAKRFGSAADLASKSLNSVISRFNTAVFDIFKEMSTNSIALGFSEVISSVTDLITNSNETFVKFSDIIGNVALKFAEFIRHITPKDLEDFAAVVIDTTTALGWMAGKIIELIKWMKDNKETVLDVGVAYVTFKYGVLGLIPALTALQAEMLATASSSAIMAKALGAITLVLASVLIAVTGFKIGEILYDQFEIVRKAAFSFIVGFEMLPNVVEASMNAIVANMKSAANELAGFKLFDVDSQPAKQLSDVLADQITIFDKNVNNMEKLFQAGKHGRQKEELKSVLDSLGLGKAAEESKILQERLAKLSAEGKKVADSVNSIGGSKAGGGRFGSSETSVLPQVRRKISEAVKEYKQFSEELKTLREYDQISALQSFQAQEQALRLYTDKAKELVEQELSVTKDPKDRERLNHEIIKLEQDYQIQLTKIAREGWKERIKIADALRQAEIEGRTRPESPQEEFLTNWAKNQGKIAAQLRDLGGAENEAMADRFVEAMRGKLEQINLAEKISFASFFATDDEKFFLEVESKARDFKQMILAATSLTEEEKKQMVGEAAFREMITIQERVLELNARVASSMSNMFNSIADFAGNAAGKSSAAYKTLFAISKAFALADAGLKLQQAIMNASVGAPFPANLASMAAVASALGSVVSQISSITFSGAYDKGGNIPTGSWGIVGEKGPEIVAGPANVTSRKDTAALIQSAASSNSGPSISIENINVSVKEKDGQSSADQAKQIGVAIEQQLRSLILDELRTQQRPGNMFNRNSTPNVFA